MPRGKTRRGEESRARLLAAAAAEFARQGYHEAKVSDIVAAAGLTQAAFYLYFPSKEAIFAHLVADFRERLRLLTDAARLIAGLPPGEVPLQARASLETLFRFLANDPNLARVGWFLAPEAEEIRREVALLVAGNLGQNQAEGILRPGLSVEVVAECIVGSVERLAVRWLLTGEKSPAELAAEATEIWLHGILAQG